MARKDRLAEVFSTQAPDSREEKLPDGNRPSTAKGKPAPFGLSRYAAEHLQKPNGKYIQEIDPDLIDRSGPVDRMDDLDLAAEDVLRESIAKTGQTTPVLLRPDPAHSGRFKIIYGRRRVRAIRALGLKVKAIIRDDLTDEDAVIIQGQENSVRKDLSFLERARFLVAIEAEGFPRAVAIDALAIDKARASNYAKLGNTLPDMLARLIGPAPGIGRDRWLSFVAAFEENPEAHARVEQVLTSADRSMVDSDSRFALAFAALTRTPAAQPVAAPDASTGFKRDIGIGEGKGRVVYASIKSTRDAVSVTLPARSALQKEFSEHMTSRIDAMIREELARWQKSGGSAE